MAEIRKEYTQFNEAMALNMPLCIAKDDIVLQNDFFLYSPNEISKSGVNNNAIGKGMVIGKFTGYFTATEYEVRLFNPIWDKNGEPNYYVSVWDIAHWLQVTDDGTVSAPVFRDFSSRESQVSHFPHVHIDYKTVCYDHNFEELGHWDRNDTYFKNVDWYAFYIASNYGNSASVPEYKYYGDNYDPDFGIRFGNITVSKITKTKAKLEAKARWYLEGDPYWGICYSSVNNPPLLTDTCLYNDVNNDPFVIDELISGLTGNTEYHLRAFYQNPNETLVYSDTIHFTTAVTGVAPQIHYWITKITNNSCRIGYGVIDEGDSEITSKKVFFGLTENPTTEVTMGDPEIGDFAEINGLTANTKYYAKIQATNSDGTTNVKEYYRQVYYASGLTQPLLQEDGAMFTKQFAGLANPVEMLPSAITETGVTLSGYVSEDGGLAVTKHGFVWSDTNKNPMITDSFKEFTGNGKEQFNHTITGLKKGTQYFYRAYAINGAGTAYSQGASTFTTAGVSLTTTAITDITETTAVTGGSITSAKSIVVTERGVCYGTKPLPTVKDLKITAGSGVGSFTATLTGLVGGGKYYVRSYAKYSSGEFYGNEINFIATLPVDPYPFPNVGTISPSEINSTSALSGFYYIVDSEFWSNVGGILWSTSPITDYSGALPQAESEELKPIAMTGLTPNTTYYVRAFVTYLMGEFKLGKEYTFTTLAQQVSSPEITQELIFNETTKLSEVHITVVSDGGAEIIKYGVKYTKGTEVKIIESNTNVISLDRLPTGELIIQGYAINIGKQKGFADDTITIVVENKTPSTAITNNVEIFSQTLENYYFTDYYNGVSIKYPINNSRLFIFSPYYIEMVGTEYNQKCTISANGYTSTRYTDSDFKVRFPLADIIRTFFTDVNLGNMLPTGTLSNAESKMVVKNARIDFDIAGYWTYYLTYNLIYGSLQLAEIEQPLVEIYQFGSYPLTITNISGTRYKNRLSSSYETEDGFGKEIDIVKFKTLNSNLEYVDIYDNDIVNTLVKSYRIVQLSNCEGDVYLRWVYNGEYKYFLLKTNVSYSPITKGESIKRNIWSLEKSTENQIESGTETIKNNGNDVIECGIVPATYNQQLHLTTLQKSKDVWMYINSAWLKVSVEMPSIQIDKYKSNTEILVKVIKPDLFMESL